MTADQTPLDRIDRLREAIDDAVDDLNAVWGGMSQSEECVTIEELEGAIRRLQHARTADDLANGRDWVDHDR